MFEIDTKEQMSLVLQKSQPGIHLALIVGSPYLLIILSRPAPQYWDSEYTTLHLMHLNSFETSSHFEFSVLAVFNTFWENALPGAGYFSISDFFDFFDPGTERWLKTVISQGVVWTLTVVQGYDEGKRSLLQLGYQDLIRHYRRYLERGMSAVAAIRQSREAVLELQQRSGRTLSEQQKQAILTPNFAEVKEFLFSTWPDDPYKAFVLEK